MIVGSGEERIPAPEQATWGTVRLPAMLDHLASLRADSDRFLEVIRSGEPVAPVPSCPGWRLADLGWHLTEVQYFWACIVEGALAEPGEVAPLQRPADDELADTFARHTARLADALAARSPDDACWSWHAAGGSVGWVRRRQAHEALVHRVDAEQAVDDRTAVDPRLANDGVDELVRIMLTGVPAWGRFSPDGTTAVLETTDRPGSWCLELGRFTGTSPESGNAYDLDAAELLEERPADPTATLRATSTDLDLWLWGRGPADVIAVTGGRAVVERIRAMAAESTQ